MKIENNQESDSIKNRVEDLNPRWVRAGDLPRLFCSWDLAYRCQKSGWLTPVIQGNRRTIFRIQDVHDCMDRMEKGEFPAPR